MKPTVLIVDDEKHTRDGLRAALEDKYETFVAKDAAEAARLMQDVPPDAVLTDLRMAGEDGLAVIDRALKLSPQPVCLMMTAYGDVETAVQAMSRGAYWFMQKPVDLRQVELLLERGLKARATEKEVAVLKTRLDRKFSLGEVVGSSAALQHAIEQVRSVATSNATVLLLGETGTGKELFAQMIHQASNRAKGPFMAVHCAAIPANLLESELFGHEKGSFTGANERRVGRFESADGGTLFLDEIGEIDATTQIKLLRFLETRSVERLGSHKPIALDLRLVCATNRDLLQMVKEGKFREDLSTTASPSCRCACRRYANGKTTSPCCWPITSNGSPPRITWRRCAWPPMPWACWPATLGLAISANSATRARTWPCCVPARCSPRRSWIRVMRSRRTSVARSARSCPPLPEACSTRSKTRRSS